MISFGTPKHLANRLTDERNDRMRGMKTRSMGNPFHIPLTRDNQGIYRLRSEAFLARSLKRADKLDPEVSRKLLMTYNLKRGRKSWKSTSWSVTTMGLKWDEKRAMVVMDHGSKAGTNGSVLFVHSKTRRGSHQATFSYYVRELRREHDILIVDQRLIEVWQVGEIWIDMKRGGEIIKARWIGLFIQFNPSLTGMNIA